MFTKKTYRSEFKTHLQRLGYSKSSQSVLSSCVAEFLDQIEEKNIYELHKTEPTHIQEHYEYLTQRPNKRREGGLSSMMITHHIYAIRIFLNFLEQTGIITENPISGLIFPKPESKPREVLTIDEIQGLYEIAKTYREKAILGIFYGCGLRRSEGVVLNIKDISFKSGLLYVREGKGKKRRIVPINEKVKEDFKNYYYNERKDFFTKRTDREENIQAFILSGHGNRMSAGTFNNIVKSLVEKSKIEKKISLHCLRHSIATHLINNGLPLEYVRDFLGHKYLESTQIYTRISKKRLFQL